MPAPNLLSALPTQPVVRVCGDGMDGNDPWVGFYRLEEVRRDLTWLKREGAQAFSLKTGKSLDSDAIRIHPDDLEILRVIAATLKEGA